MPAALRIAYYAEPIQKVVQGKPIAALRHVCIDRSLSILGFPIVEAQEQLRG
jgi:hypothetical protein